MEGHLYKRGKSKTWYLLYDLPKPHSDKRKQCSVRIGKMPKSHAVARKREICGASIKERGSRHRR